MFVLAWFRDRPGIGRPGQGSGISQASAYGYLIEAIEVLAAKAPSLCEALDKAAPCNGLCSAPAGSATSPGPPSSWPSPGTK